MRIGNGKGRLHSVRVGRNDLDKIEDGTYRDDLSDILASGSEADCDHAISVDDDDWSASSAICHISRV